MPKYDVVVSSPNLDTALPHYKVEFKLDDRSDTQWLHASSAQDAMALSIALHKAGRELAELSEEALVKEYRENHGPNDPVH